MRLKHFLKLKEKTNQETWTILTRYNLASILYRWDKDFKYMISNNTIKTEKPNINFHYEDIINYLKKQNTILELPKNSRKTKNLQTNNTKRIQTLYWNSTGTNTHHKFHGTIYGKTPSTHITGQKTTTYSTYCYILWLGLMIKYIDGQIKNIWNPQIANYVTKQRI